jgi:hypothetical protein
MRLAQKESDGMRSKSFLLGAIVAAFVVLGAPVPLDAQNRTGVLKINTNPPGATVEVDGRVYGQSPQIIELPAGKHRVLLKRPGYESVVRTVIIKQDRILRTTVRLEPTRAPVKAPPRPAPGAEDEDDIRVHETGDNEPDAGPGTVVVVTSPPGLTVFMNEFIVPQATPVAFDVKAGVYELAIQQDGETVYRKTVYVQAGRTLELDLLIKKVRKIDYSDPWK